MAPRPLESLRVRLLLAGISPRQVHRYVSELRDHAADLAARERAAGLSAAEAEARALVILGEETDLYRAMLERGAPRSIAARIPWAAFGVFPLIALLVVFVPLVWGTFALLFPYRELGGADIPQGVRAAATALTLISGYLLAPALAAACVVVALRQRLASNWVWVGLGLIALAAAPLGIQVEFLSAGGGIRGSAALAIHHRGQFDGAATAALIAVRAVAFFGLSAVAYRLLQIHLRHRDARDRSPEIDHA
jgi:hypothetical protein